MLCALAALLDVSGSRSHVVIGNVPSDPFAVFIVPFSVLDGSVDRPRLLTNPLHHGLPLPVFEDRVPEQPRRAVVSSPPFELVERNTASCSLDCQSVSHLCSNEMVADSFLEESDPGRLTRFFRNVDTIDMLVFGHEGENSDRYSRTL